MKTKIVTMEALTKASNDIIENHEGKVVVTGVRLVNNSQTGKKDSLEFEFLQQRTLEGRTLNVLGLLHLGDSRWSSGATKMRVWSTVTKEAAIKTLGLQESLVDQLIDESQNLKEGERLALMAPIAQINTPEGKKGIKIVCIETTDSTTLPQSIQAQLLTEYANRYILQAPSGENKELENVVDENGNKVYRYFRLGISEEKDQMVPNKLSVSRYLNQQKEESLDVSMGLNIGLTE